MYEKEVTWIENKHNSNGLMNIAENVLNNDDRGTDFVNCQAECEVEKDVGIACIHYEEDPDIDSQEEIDE